MNCDASDDGLGAVLSQNHQGAEHVVYYANRTLTYYVLCHTKSDAGISVGNRSVSTIFVW